jgi:hypothetical protein
MQCFPCYDYRYGDCGPCVQCRAYLSSCDRKTNGRIASACLLRAQKYGVAMFSITPITQQRVDSWKQESLDANIQISRPCDQKIQHLKTCKTCIEYLNQNIHLIV